MLKTFEIILDIEKDLYTPSNLLFSVSQNDFDSVQLDFTINQDGAAFNLTGSTVEFACKKPSGLTVYQAAEIVSAAEGKARLLLSVQAYSEYGVYTAEIYIRDSDQLAVTNPFYYSSREPVFGATEIESVNDWSALQEVLFAMDKKPLLVDGVPTTIPEYIGQMAFDTTGRRAFIANAEIAEGWQLLAAGEGGGGGIVYWNDILGKPLTFAPAAHTHDEYLTPAEADLLYQPIGTGGAPAEHEHTTADITDFATGVAAAIPAEYLTTTEGNTAYQPKGTYLTAVPAEYLTETEAAAIYQPKGSYLTAVPPEYLTETEAGALYQPIGTYLTAVPAEYLTQTEGDARYAIKGTEGGTIAAAWGDIAGTLSNQLDLQAALDAKADDAELAGKADTEHTHTTGEITDFAAGVAANIPAEYLTATEGAASFQAKGNYLTAVPAEYLTETEGDTKYMAAGATPTPAAHTHTTGEITDFAAGVAANIPAEYLTATEGDAAYQPKGTYLTTIPAEYLTETEGDALYQPKGDYLTAIPAHQHTAADITDFGTAVAGAIPAEYLTATEGNAAYQPKGTYLTTIPAEYLTETEGNALYQPKGTYLTAVPAEYLTETEAAAAYQPKGTYLTAVPLASAAAVGGGRIGNGLGMTGEYMHVKTGAGLGINSGNFALQVQTVNAAPTPLNFWTGTATDYAALTKDPNTLYFVTG